jgi:DNA ligase-1
MPEFIAPMLAKPATKPLTDHIFYKDYVAEPKHDGMRVVIVKDTHDMIEVFGRSGKVYTKHVPHLVLALDPLMPADSAVDGELGYIDKVIDYIPVVNFNKTMRVMGSLPERAVGLQGQQGGLNFILFDVMRWSGRSLLDTAWGYRHALLQDLFNDEPHDFLHVNAVFSRPEFFPLVFTRLTGVGIEGLVLKNTYAPYQPGKRANKTWYKFKSVKTFDVVVTGFTDGQGKYEGQIGAIKFGAFDQSGKVVEVGQCSGMTDAERLWWTRHRDSWLTVHNLSKIVIEVKCNDLVGSGEYRTPRHPQYVRVRTDKLANSSDCSMEQFK